MTITLSIDPNDARQRRAARAFLDELDAEDAQADAPRPKVRRPRTIRMPTNDELAAAGVSAIDIQRAKRDLEASR